uniref:Uncharacterized protein n=1 Tax=Glossina austeni TaxID=7395 RepID=A0A1A9VWY3_GLOAU
MERKQKIQLNLKRLQRQIFERKPHLQCIQNQVCRKLKQQIEDSAPLVALCSLGALGVEHLRRDELKHFNLDDEVPLSELIQKATRPEENTKGTDECMYNSTVTIYATKAIDSVFNQGKLDQKVMGKADTPVYTCVPDLACRSTQHISLESINFARKFFDLRARQAEKSLKSARNRHQTPRRKHNKRKQKYITKYSEQAKEREFSQLVQAVMADSNDADNLQISGSSLCVNDTPNNSNNSTRKAKKRKSPTTAMDSSAKKHFRKQLAEFITFNDDSNTSIPPATSLQQAITSIDENRTIDTGNGKFVDITNSPASLSLFFENSTKDFNFQSILHNQEHVDAQQNDQPAINVAEPLINEDGSVEVVDMNTLPASLPLSVENSTKDFNFQSILHNQEHVATQQNDQPAINVAEPLINEDGSVEVVDMNTLPASLSLSVENSTKDFNFQSILHNQEHVAEQLNDQPAINVEEPLMQNAVGSYLVDYSSEVPLDLSLNKTKWNARNCCSMQLGNSEDDCAPLDLCVRSSANMAPQVKSSKLLSHLNNEQHNLSVNEDVSFSARLDSPFLSFDQDEFNATCMRASLTEEMQVSLRSPTNDDSMRTSMNNVNCSIGGKTENEMLFSDDNMRQNNLTLCGNADQFGINYNENEENSKPPEKKTITRETNEANLLCIPNPKVNDENECFTQKLNHSCSEQTTAINHNNNIRANGMNMGLRSPDADCLDTNTDDLNKGSLAASSVILTISDELRDETFFNQCENDPQTRECFTAVDDHNGKNENIRNHSDDDNELKKDQVNSEKEMFADKSTQPPEKIFDDNNKKQPPACKSMTERAESLLEMGMQLPDKLDFGEDDDDLDVLSLTASDNIR